MITAPGCGMCSLAKINLKREGLLDSITILQPPQAMPLILQTGLKSVPIFIVLDENKKIMLQTLDVRAFIKYMKIQSEESMI